jgi:virginiamycin B lyase
MKIARAALVAAALVPLSAGAARITHFPTNTAAAVPLCITLGPDGFIWFTEFAKDQLGRMATNGTHDEFPTPTAGSHPNGIAVGPDGYIYFSEQAISKIGVVNSNTPASWPEYATKTSSAQPVNLVAGPDGAVYFSEAALAKVGRIDNAGTVTEHDTHGGGTSWGVAKAGGGIAYTESDDLGVAWYVGRDGSEKAVALTTGSDPKGLVVATDGAAWILENGTNKVLRIADTNQEFDIPTAMAGPLRIIAGTHADVWFVEFAVHNLGHATSDGVITEFFLGAGSSPRDLAWGADGNIWITEAGTSSIARFIPVVPGDVNGDGSVDVSDVFYVINFLFAGGPPPVAQ